MTDWIDPLETRRLLAAGPAVTGFKISPRSPGNITGSLVFTVTYTDTSGIDATSFDNRDLRIAGPNDFARYATAAGSTSNDLGTVRTVRYKIPAPGGAWDSNDNGTYTVRLHGEEVFDTLANASDPQLLGKFGVNIITGQAAPRVIRMGQASTSKVIDLIAE
jgi:hypothetical protein